MIDSADELRTRVQEAQDIIQEQNGEMGGMSGMGGEGMGGGY